MTTARRTSRYRGTGRAAAPLAGAVIAAAMIHAGAAMVHAEPDQIHYYWINTCEDTFTCNIGYITCWCEITWNVSGNWRKCLWNEGSCYAYEDPPVSTPQASGDYVFIEHSTTDSRCWQGPSHRKLCSTDTMCGTCNGGFNDGDPCYSGLQQTTCTKGGGTCTAGNCEPEQWLTVIITQTCCEEGQCEEGQPVCGQQEDPEDIVIGEFKIEAELSGMLTVRFESEDSSNTLTAARLIVDGNNGPIDLQARDYAVLKTDPND